jgi:hypothetical protein
MANNPNYFFRCSGDRYQHVMGYMSRHIPGLKKQGISMDVLLHRTGRSGRLSLTADEARDPLDSIDTGSILGLRDRALIAPMTYTLPASAPLPARCAARTSMYRAAARGSPARKRRQAARDALPPEAGSLSARLHGTLGRTGFDPKAPAQSVTRVKELTRLM